MSANISRPKRLRKIKNAVTAERKLKGRNKKRPNAIGRLNDFCLLQIFNRLDLEDLVNLTDLNTQFKRVSEMSFAGRYATFRYQYESKRSQIRRVLCKFGKSIKSLTFRGQCLELNAIPKFCAGGILEELHLSTNKMMNDDDYARRLFSSLKTLTLDYSEFNGYSDALFRECHELKTLHLQRIPRCEFISDVAQKYRKLEQLVIGNDVNDRTARALLMLNRRITKLDLPGTYATTFAMLSKMVHLEELSIRRVRDVSRYNNIAKLAALNSLRVLKLHSVNPKFVTMIVEAMEKVHSLDCFKCYDYSHDRDWSDYQFADQIKKLKTLKSFAFIVRHLLLGDCFAELGGQLPLLQELELKFSEKQWQNDPVRSTGNLIRFIELSSTLDVLLIRTLRPEAFNQHFYDRLLRVIERRQSTRTFKVKFCCPPLLLPTLNIHSNLLQVEVITSWC